MVRAFPTIGITGPVASGKSAVRRALEARGFFGVDADVEVRRAYADPAVRRAVARTLGFEAYRLDGSINAWFLRRRVFEDPRLRAWLERLLYPLLDERVAELRARAHEEGSAGFVVEAVNLHRMGIAVDLDDRVAVVCSRRAQAERLGKTGVSFPATLRLFAAQPTAREYAERATYVIRNDGTLDELEAEVDRFLASRGYL